MAEFLLGGLLALAVFVAGIYVGERIS